MATLFKLLFRAVFLLVIILSFTSCSDEDKEVHQYSYKYIMWKMGEGDGVEEIEHEVDPIVRKNPSTETINVTFSETDLVEESSQFSCKDPQLLAMVTGTNNVQVPITDATTILREDYGYLVSSLKAPLDLNKNILSPTITTTSMLELPPNSEVTIKGIIKLKKITASYKAVFTDENDESPIEIEGKWVGIFQNGSHITFITKDMKN